MAMELEACSQALRTLIDKLSSFDFKVMGGGFKSVENGYVLHITLNVSDKKREALLPLTYSDMSVEYTFVGPQILS